MSEVEKKYQIFISSTYTDLIKAREEVTKVILNMYHFPIGMEMFSADNEDQWETIKETIDSSDYYILIIGHRYGSETSEGISYTEKEYNYAKEIGLPIYTYIRDREARTSPSERDKEPEKLAKLETFIKKATTGIMVEFWGSPVELGKKVSIALPKAFRKKPRVGWIKADNAVSSKALEQIFELIQEVRELREENEKLRVVDKRHPDLSVRFNDEETIIFSLKKDFKTNKLLTRASYEYPNELSHEAHIYYQKSIVDNYNKWFDDNPEVVKKYNDMTFKHEQSRNALTRFSIQIANTGSAKANDVNVTIKFPDSIKIYDSNTRFFIKDLPPPAQAAENPTKIAKDALDRQRGKLNTTQQIYSSINDEYVTIKDNSVFIRYKEILHFKKMALHDKYDLFIMPLYPGHFVAQVEVLCEEYAEPKKIEIPIAISLD